MSIARFQDALNKYFDNPQAKGALNELYTQAVACDMEDHEIMQQIFIRQNVAENLATKGVGYATAELSKKSIVVKSSDSHAQILELAENIICAESCAFTAQFTKAHAVTEVARRPSSQKYASDSYAINLRGPINTTFNKVRILGDGHCMFRAFAFSLLHQFSTKPEATRNLVDRLNAIKDTIPADHLAIFPHIKSHIQVFIDALTDERNAYLKLNDEAISDRLVESLRYLACYQNSFNEEFLAILAAEPSRGAYFQDMMNMSKRKYGGQEEFTALSRIFGITVLSLNFTSKEISIARPQLHEELEGERMFVTLHFNPGHYDACSMSQAQATSILAESRGRDSVGFITG